MRAETHLTHTWHERTPPTPAACVELAHIEAEARRMIRAGKLDVMEIYDAAGVILRRIDYC